MVSDCIFCKIANGEIPTNTIYEDDNFRVILDAAPANLGHCLVLPKTHSANIIEMKPELVGKGFMVAQKIAKAVQKATDCDGVNILQNNGEVAGQTVFHFHIHIIPRLKSDDVEIGFGSFKIDDVASIKDKIIENL
jgi:hit-like protein involved in cell-cycle regulation